MEEAAPPDGHRRLLPHEEQDFGTPPCGRARGSSERRIEYHGHRVRLMLPTCQGPQDSRHPADIAKSVGVYPECRNAELPESAGDGGVLSRVIEDNQIGTLG